MNACSHVHVLCGMAQYMLIFTMCIIIISYYIFIFHEINKGFTININMYIVKLNYWLGKIR